MACRDSCADLKPATVAVCRLLHEQVLNSVQANFLRVLRAVRMHRVVVMLRAAQMLRLFKVATVSVADVVLATRANASACFALKAPPSYHVLGVRCRTSRRYLGRG